MTKGMGIIQSNQPLSRRGDEAWRVDLGVGTVSTWRDLRHTPGPRPALPVKVRDSHRSSAWDGKRQQRLRL